MNLALSTNRKSRSTGSTGIMSVEGDNDDIVIVATMITCALNYFYLILRIDYYY